MKHQSSLLLVGVLLTACASADPATRWELVGAYDATATLEAGRVPVAGYVWEPAAGMEASCGPSKGPLGLGTFEAEAIGNGLTPTLALVLRYGGPGRPQPLSPETLQVAVVDPDDVEGERFPLEPAVSPRRLAMEVTGPPETAQVQHLVNTQLSIELCLEHKLGRAWLGNDAARVRQAFMLDRPRGTDGEGEDRRYFAGQREPVPPLLGPPDACAVLPPGQRSTGELDGLGGAGSLRMAASDIWSANLRPCSSRDPMHPEAALTRPDLLPLRSSTPWGRLAYEPPAPRRIRVAVSRDAEQFDRFDLLDVSVQEGQETTTSILAGPELLFPNAVEDPTSTDLTDVLALLKHQYPLVRDGTSAFDNPNEPGSDWYTVLLVPDWQVVQAVSLLAQGSQPKRAQGMRNGVAWLLANPQFLSLQVAPGAETRDIDDATESAPIEGAWPDLMATAIGREFRFVRDWGYTVGLLHGREPVFLPADGPVPWEVAQLAQRANLQGGFLAALAAFLFILGAGLRRVRDLWTPVPKERADYWPGVGLDEADVPESAADSPSSTVPTE